MSSRKMVIAIDGPAGAGKSTIAARLAKSLGYINLESGAMYRALALKALERHTPLDDGDALQELARESDIQLEPCANGNRVLLDGHDVSQRIREPDVTTAASRVSIHPQVRQLLVARQRELGEIGGVVMEGRDIGTAVFPNADVKIFLDANSASRAERRLRQDPSRALKDLKGVLAEIKARDERDRTRTVSPLIPAPDAVVIDTTHKSVDEVIAEVQSIIAGAQTK